MDSFIKISVNKKTKINKKIVIEKGRIVVLVLCTTFLILTDIICYPNKSYSKSNLNKNYSTNKVEGIENFPESFKPYLYELKKNQDRKSVV